jgi:hypothetical protein
MGIERTIIGRCVATALLPMALMAAACSSQKAMSSCPSIDEYCAGLSQRCVRDWATAQQPSTWCTNDGGTTNHESVFIQADCDGFDFVYLVGFDNGIYYYYDPQSGQLVGVGSAIGAPEGNFCLAGTGPPHPPGVLCGDGGATRVCGPTAS